MKNDYSILVLCEHLEVSPSGYYDWLNRRTILRYPAHPFLKSVRASANARPRISICEIRIHCADTAQ